MNDLIRRLRTIPYFSSGDCTFQEAADRIEELEEICLARSHVIEESTNKIEALEEDVQRLTEGYENCLERHDIKDKRIAILEKLDQEAATYVESVICLRTHFTGNRPYVGWKGLGLALRETLDILDRYEAALKEIGNPDTQLSWLDMGDIARRVLKGEDK